MPVPYQIMLGLLTSIAIHTLLFVFLKPSSDLIPTKPLPITAVGVIFKTKPRQSDSLPKPKSSNDLAQNKSGNAKHKRTNSPNPSSMALEVKAQDSYASLLPKSREMARMSSDTSLKRKVYTGEKLEEIIMETSDLSADFDIPLVLRRDISDGNCSARLKLYPEGAIEIESLTGQPEIRAALFETLTLASARTKIKDLFRYFQSSNIKISIEYSTDSGLDKQSEFATELKIFDQEALIRITRYPRAPKFGITGVPIEDKDSKLAKARDRAELSKLRSSLAFRHSISHYRY